MVFGFPALAICRQSPLTCGGGVARACVKKLLVLALVRRQRGDQQDVTVAVIEEIGHSSGSVCGETL